MTTQLIVQVAVPAPLHFLFDYLPPANVDTAELKPGCRVSVPFGHQEHTGIIISTQLKAPDEDIKLKSIRRVLDKQPLFHSSDIEFLRWCSDYYQHPIGEVFEAALPIRLRAGKDTQQTSITGWQLPDPTINLEQFKRAPVQRRIIQQLQKTGAPLSIDQFDGDPGSIRDALKRLEKKAVIHRCLIEHPSPTISRAADVTLTNEQQKAVEQLQRINGFQPVLLDGITGSGKTEVYLQTAEAVIAQGKQVLVLVPEIALTPQLMQRFQEGISGRCVVMHSGLNAGERERAWLDAMQHKADLVLGTRSAIFTPIMNLGLIIVDEEHDISYKQQEGFRYSARDASVVKAKLNDVPVILGSATPSLETISNAMQDKYLWLKLRQRPGKAVPPSMIMVDIRAQRLNSGISSQLFKAVREDLDAGNQVILFLNRRGYAPQLTCSECGWIAECSHCDARMTWHQQMQRLWCHHCGHQTQLPATCPDCGAEESLVYLGQGTEKVEETIKTVFPEVPVIRIDRDTTRRKGSLQSSLDKVHQAKEAILVGTQMLAKGHDFPNVTLVGILNTDSGLLNPDFRAAERTAQLLLQVAGRSGRAEKPGRVLIQTRHPDNPLLKTLITKGYNAFAKTELEQRKLAQFPPTAYQILFRAESTDSNLVQHFMQQLREACNNQITDIECWGPSPALLERKAGHFRWHLLLQSPGRNRLHHQAKHILNWLRQQKVSRKVRWSVDVDPQEVL